MNTRSKTWPEDVVDRAVGCLRQAPVPNGPPPDLLEAVLAAGARRAAEPKARTIREGSFKMNRITRFAAAIAIVAGIAGLAVWLFIGNGVSSVAFGEVVKNMQDAQSLSFDAILRRPDKPEVRYHNDISGARYRKTSSSGTIQIADGEQGKLLDLDPSRKRAHIRSYEAEAAGPIDFLLAYVEKLRTEQIENLGRKDLDGQEVVGFRAQTTDAIQREQQISVWVDPGTRYPVRIETLYVEDGVSLVIYNFAWNPNLDESLFRMTAPEGEGYEVTDETK